MSYGYILKPMYLNWEDLLFCMANYKYIEPISKQR